MTTSNRSISDLSDGTDWILATLAIASRTEATKSLRLQAALREAIRSGRLDVNDRLPATRTLAVHLGVARNVVVDAYDQLINEGYLSAQTGSGTRVAQRQTAHVPSPKNRSTHPTERTTQPSLVDLSPGVPDLVGFPIREWRQCLREVLDELPAAAFGYTTGRGAYELRLQLSKYLQRVRGADVQPDHVVITTGVSASLGLLVRAVTKTRSQPLLVATEDPHSYTQRGPISAAGALIRGVPVDAEGIRVDLIGDADLVVVTPAHQYPLGMVMSPQRREALITWARARPGRYVVEDDYDAEFRFDRRPIGTLQGLAPDVVVLTSSVSKTLSPALRMGWMVVPKQLSERVAEQITAEWLTPDTVSQHALAKLIASGRYDRILRLRRRTYQQRRTELVEAISGLTQCEVTGAAGGLHLTIMLPSGGDDRVVSAALRAEQLLVPPLSEYRMSAGDPGLVVSYSNLLSGQATRFAQALDRVLDDV